MTSVPLTHHTEAAFEPIARRTPGMSLGALTMVTVLEAVPREKPPPSHRAQRLRASAELIVCLTGDTMSCMSEVTVRDLRNHGGEVLDRVVRGEALTVTRDGKAVAELRPLQRRPVPAAVLLTRWRALPRLDAAQLKADIDRLLDGSV
jgi:prevent-host-death family protein